MAHATATPPASTPASTPAGARTLELARYVTTAAQEADFVARHGAAIRAVRERFPDLDEVVVVRLATTPERTTWVDVAVWRSADAAHRAAEACMSIPEFAECARFMDAVLGVEHGEVVARY